jgi:aspartyl-tRNA synthetase
MYRTHTCGELRISDLGKEVTLSGWVQTSRDKGFMMWIDLRDRYGVTQLLFNEEISSKELLDKARSVGREFVVMATGKVIERISKNDKIPTGEIEIEVNDLSILNPAKLPPFTIDEDTDGGDDLRMKYRYLDLRRGPLQRNIRFRSQLALETRKYLSDAHFLEIETPFLIKSTPEGARDFVVPSRMNPGQFYALPQSPQTFKQILMVGGMDRYFQIVKCFRDEDLRADRQPEFTQIDCEMAFVTQEEVLATFEGLTKHLFKTLKGIELPDFPLMNYDEAMRRFGSDKPDLRFGMEFAELNGVAQGKGFKVFDSVELIVGICAEGCASYTRKQVDELTKWVQRPQIGAKGLVYVKYNEDGSFKSSVDKFFSAEDLKAWADKMNAKPGDLLLVLAGETDKTRKQLNELRLEMGRRLGLMKAGDFQPLWVVDFPLLEWDEEAERFHAMHHPFTSPKKEDVARMLDGDHQTMKSLTVGSPEEQMPMTWSSTDQRLGVDLSESMIAAYKKETSSYLALQKKKQKHSLAS